MHPLGLLACLVLKEIIAVHFALVVKAGQIMLYVRCSPEALQLSWTYAL